MPVRPAASESKLSSMQAETNLNVSWLSGSYTWAIYLLAIVAFRYVLYFTSPILSHQAQWTALFLAHGIFTFWSLHWKRGSPFWEDQGEYLDRTMWEQIDNGVPWTNARKFLMIVPIVLYIMTLHFTEYEKNQLFINSVMLIVLIIAKLPEMHGVRLFRINKGPDAE